MFHFSPLVAGFDKVINQHKPYRQVLFNTYQSEKFSLSDEKDFADAFLGVLRNYFLLNFAIADSLSDYKEKTREAFLLMISLYLLRFKKADKEAVYQSYEEAKILLRLAVDEADFNEVYNLSISPKLLKEEVKKSPYLYNSLNLNIPEFLLISLVKDFGTELAPKVALSLKERGGSFYLPFKEDEIDSPLFSKIRLNDTEYIYKASDRKKVKDAIKAGLDAFPLDYSLAYFLGKADEFSLGMKALLFNQTTPFLSLYLEKKLSSYVGQVVSIFPHLSSYRLALDMKKKYPCDNLEAIFTKTELVKTYEAYDSFQLVLYRGMTPFLGVRDLAFSLLPSFSEKDLVASSNKQLVGLLEACEFVKKDGLLLFYNSSLTSIDSKKVTTQFLKEKNNFAVLKEGFLLPFEHDSDGGYYCLMRREY